MCRSVQEKLPAGSVYRLVFSALVDILPDAPDTPAPQERPGAVPDLDAADKADTAETDAVVEEDPEEMPYPLHYE